MLGNQYETQYVSSPIEDNSLYLDDATFLLKAVNTNIFKQAVREQLEMVNRTAFDQNATPDELYEAVCKLRRDVEVFSKVMRIKDKK